MGWNGGPLPKFGEQAGRSMIEFERWMGLLGHLPTAVPNSLSLAQANNEKVGMDPRN